MYAADAATMAAGIGGETLMENAGRGVARAVAERWRPCRTTILCGPGNNGGDGFVAARHLREAGFEVTVALLGARDALTGDAAAMAARWPVAVADLAPAAIGGAELVVDGLFGAGLSRPLGGAAAATVDAVAESGLPVAAIDVPSGVHGDSGAVLGTAAAAALTVTFFLRKPGHLLMPGRELMGELLVADIGTPPEILDSIAPAAFENGPGLWRDAFPWPAPADHKYSRGHAIVVSGAAERTGAARLAARAALRTGAGLVTVACPPDALAVNAAHLTSVMCTAFAGAEGLGAVLADRRRNAVLLGPGNGVGAPTRDNVLSALAADKAAVLDADALTSFEDDPTALLDALGDACVLTPARGRVPPAVPRSRRRRQAPARPRSGAAERRDGAAQGARQRGRGAGRARRDQHGGAAGARDPPARGDVLAGIVLGLLAQGMPTFEAAAAAAWLHGTAAAGFGPGLIAEDIVECIPTALRALRDGGGGR